VSASCSRHCSDAHTLRIYGTSVIGTSTHCRWTLCGPSRSDRLPSRSSSGLRLRSKVGRNHVPSLRAHFTSLSLHLCPYFKFLQRRRVVPSLVSLGFESCFAYHLRAFVSARMRRRQRTWSLLACDAVNARCLCSHATPSTHVVSARMRRRQRTLSLLTCDAVNARRDRISRGVC
jgi:hypothetical protein